jgi:uncharacterized cupin superfamily protein
MIFPPEDTPQIVHRTDTIDYLTIVSGKIELTMVDGGVVELSAGDTAVQLGALHQWWNKTDEPCIMTFVQIGVAPRSPNGPS